MFSYFHMFATLQHVSSLEIIHRKGVISLQRYCASLTKYNYYKRLGKIYCEFVIPQSLGSGSVNGTTGIEFILNPCPDTELLDIRIVV